MTNENGGAGDEEYVSPFIVLPHTLSDEDAKTLRNAVYAHYEE